MLHLQPQRGRARTLGGPARGGLAVSGTLSKNGKDVVSVKTQVMPGPLHVAKVKLYNMSLTLDDSSDYKFTAVAVAAVGTKTLTVDIAGTVGHQPPKGQRDSMIHSVQLTGTLPEAVLISGDKTAITVKDLTVFIKGYLQGGLVACDKKNPSPCAPLTLPPGPQLLEPSTVALLDEDTTGPSGNVEPVTYARWEVSSFLSGSVDFGGIATSQFELELDGELFDPVSSTLVANLTDVDVSPSVRLSNGQVRWVQPSDGKSSATVAFNADVDIGSEVAQFAVEGYVNPGRLALAGTLPLWRIPLGPGVEVRDLSMTIKVEWDVVVTPAARCSWKSAGNHGVHQSHHIQRPEGGCPTDALRVRWSEEQCKQACDREIACVALEYTPKYGQCCLLDCSVGTAGCMSEQSSHTDHVVLDCTARDQVSGFVGPYADQGITGHNDLGMLPGIDLESCADSCRQKADCKSIEYGRSKESGGARECWLSSSTRATFGASFNLWPGWDYYEVPGVDFNATSSNRTRQHREWSVSASAGVAFGGSAWEFGFNASSSAVDGLAVSFRPAAGSDATLETVVRGAVGAVSSASGSSFGTLGSHLMRIKPDNVNVFLSPVRVRATVNQFTLPGAGLSACGVLSVRNDSGSWRWGLSVQTIADERPNIPVSSKGFKLSDLIDRAPPALDVLALTHGMLTMANEPTNATVVHTLDGFQDLPSSMQVPAGFTVSAVAMLTDVAPARTAGSLQPERYVRLSGQYAHADEASALTLSGSVKGAVQVTADLRLDGLRVRVAAASGAVSSTFVANATLLTGSLGLPDCPLSVEGSLTTNADAQTVSVSGDIRGPWYATDDIIVHSGSIALKLSRVKSRSRANETLAWGAWTASGHLHGRFNLRGMALALRIPIPMSSGITNVTADMDRMPLAPGVELVDVVSKATFQGDLAGFGAAAGAWDLSVAAGLRIAGSPDVPIKGRIGSAAWELSGSAATLDIAAGVVLSGVEVRVNGSYGQGQSAALSAYVSGAAELFGLRASGWGVYRKGAKGQTVLDGELDFGKTPGRRAAQLSAGTIPLPGGCSLELGALDYSVDGGVLAFTSAARVLGGPRPMDALVSAALSGPDVPGGGSPNPILSSLLGADALQAAQIASGGWSELAFNATAGNWSISDTYTFQEVVVEASALRINDGKKSIVATGWVRGELSVAGLTLAAEIPFPFTGGDAKLSGSAGRIHLGSTVDVHDLRVSYAGPLTSFSGAGNLEAAATVGIRTTFADRALEVAVNGSLGGGDGRDFEARGVLSAWPMGNAFALESLEVTISGRRNAVVERAASECLRDPATGQCEPALCYEANLRRWPGCTLQGYRRDGYTCPNGTGYCVRDGCGGSCWDCAERKLGLVADPTTGRCVTPWSMKAGKVAARATLLGREVASLNAGLPWDSRGELVLQVTKLELAPATTISGQLRIRSGSLTMEATLAIPGGEFVCDLAARETAGVQELSLTASGATRKNNEYKVGSFTINNLDVDLTARREKDPATGQWSDATVLGHVAGSISLAGMELRANIPLPLDGGAPITADIPPMEVVPGVRLALSLSGTPGQGQPSVAATGQLNVSALGPGGGPALFQLSGSVGKGGMQLSGTASDWVLAHGLTLQGLSLSVTRPPAQYAALNVSVDGVLQSALGSSRIAARFTVDHGVSLLQVDSPDSIGIGGLSLEGARLRVPFTAAAFGVEPMTFEATAVLPAMSSGGSSGSVTVSGVYSTDDEGTGTFDLTAEQGAAWQFAKGTSIDSLNMSLELSRTRDGNVSIDGDISGEFTVAGMKLIAAVPIPITGFRAEMPSLRIAPGVRVENLTAAAGSGVGSLTGLPQTAKAAVTGALVVASPRSPKPSLVLSVVGTFGDGQVSLNGTAPEWELVSGLSLTDLRIFCSGSAAGGRLRGKAQIWATVGIMGKEADLYGVAEGDTGDKRSLVLDGEIKWRGGKPDIDFLGDIVKTPGRRAAAQAIPGLGSLSLGTLDFDYSKAVLGFTSPTAAIDVDPRPLSLGPLSGAIFKLPAPNASQVSALAQGALSSAASGQLGRLRDLSVPQDVISGLQKFVGDPASGLQFSYLAGGTREWRISDSVSIMNVDANISIAKTATSTLVTGTVGGTVVLGGGLALSARVPIPVSSGETVLNATWDMVDMGAVVLQDGSLRYQGNLSEFANSSSATLSTRAVISTPFADDKVLNVDLEGAADAHRMSFRGTVSGWKVNAGLSLESAVASGTLVVQDGKWRVEDGLIDASGVLLGGKAHVAAAFPFATGAALIADCTNLHITNGVTLATARVAVRKEAPQFSLNATLAMGGTANALSVAGSASFADTEEKVVMRANTTQQSWEVTAGLAVEDVRVNLALSRTRADAAAAWGGWRVAGLLKGSFDWGGVHVSARVPLPLDDAAELNGTVAGLDLGGVVTVEDASFAFRGALDGFVGGFSAVNLNARVSVATPFAADPRLAFDISGSYTKERIVARGSLDDWEAVPGVLAFKGVQFKVVAARNLSAPLSPPGAGQLGCWEARVAGADPSTCFGWRQQGYRCAGEWCARDGSDGDGCSDRVLAAVADPETGRCVERLCYEARPEAAPDGCGDFPAEGYACAGGWCARDGCGGDCVRCARRVLGAVADANTGRCVFASCYEARISDFPADCDHRGSGYHCTADGRCVAEECIGDCQRCARRMHGYRADRSAGRCVGGRWGLTDASATASAVVMGKELPGLSFNYSDGLVVDVSGWALNKDTVIRTGVLRVPRNGGDITFAADASIGVGGSSFIRPKIKGRIVNSTGMEIEGSLKVGWGIMGMHVADVKLELGCGSLADPNVTSFCSGVVSGSLDINGAVVEVHVPIPLSSGTAELLLPRLRLAPGVYIEDGTGERTPNGEWRLSGRLSVDLPHIADPFSMDIEATNKAGCFNVSGRAVQPWRFKVGKGFRVDSVQASLAFGKCGAAGLQGTLSGTVSLAGVTVHAEAAFGAHQKLDITWPGGNGPSLKTFTDAFGDLGTRAAGAKSVGALDSMANTVLKHPLLRVINTSPPRANLTGMVQVFGRELHMQLLIEKDPVLGKWGFLAGVDLPEKMSFKDIEPSKGAISDTLGKLRSGVVVLSSISGTFRPGNGRELEVDAGLNFRAVVDLSSIGGQSRAKASQVDSDLTVLGHWSSDSILLRAELHHFRVTDHVVLEGVAQFETGGAGPVFWASCQATVTYDPNARPLVAQAEVSVFEGGDLEVKGYADDFHFDVGHHGLWVRRAELGISKKGSSFSGHFAGSASFGKQQASAAEVVAAGVAAESDFREGQAISPQLRPCRDNRYAGACAFDGKLSTLWDTTGEEEGDDQWIEYELSVPAPATAYSIATTDESCPAAWTLSGSNVPGVWTELDTRVNQSCSDGQFTKYELPPSHAKPYKTFRWTFSFSSGSAMVKGYRIREVQLHVAELPRYVLLGEGDACATGGLPPVKSDKMEACTIAARGVDIGEHAGPFRTPDEWQLYQPEGCHITPDQGCSVGWMPGDYGYTEGEDVDGNQPVRGVTLTECIAACDAVGKDCIAIARPPDTEDTAADCWLKRALPLPGDSRLLHTTACSEDDSWEGDDGAAARAACQAGLAGKTADQADEWCVEQAEQGDCARSCCELWAEQGKATCFGEGRGARCAFPFDDQNGTTHTECVTEPGGALPWCYTAAGNNRWGNCAAEHGDCPSKLVTYRVRCPDPGYSDAGAPGQECDAWGKSTVATLDWCREAAKGGNVKETEDGDLLPGCFRRGAEIWFNANGSTQVDPNAVKGDVALCYQGPVLWWNPLDVGGTQADDSAQSLCYASADAANGMHLEVDFAGAEVNITLQVSNNVGLSGDKVVSQLADPDAMKGAAVPNDFSEAMTTALLDLTVFISTKPITVDISATLILGSVGEVKARLLIIRDEGTRKWNFAFGFGIDQSFSMGALAPSAASLPDWMPSFPGGSVVISTFDTPFTFMQNTVTNGVAIVADLHLKEAKDGPLHVVREWTKADEIILCVAIDFGARSVQARATLHGRWRIADPVHVTSGHLFVEVGMGLRGPRAGLGVDIEAHVDNQNLKFHGELVLSLIDARFKASLETDWVNPFGLKKLTIHETEIELGIQYSCPETLGLPCPSALGLAGGLEVAGKDGDVAVRWDKYNPKQFLFAASIEHFSLDEILASFTSVKKDSGKKDWFRVDNLEVSVNPSSSPQTMAGKTYPPGIFASIGRFELLRTFAGSGRIEISKDSGLLLEGKLEPVDILGLVKIHGFHGPHTPATVKVDLRKGHREIYFSGGANILGFKCGLLAEINNDHFKIEGFASILSGRLKLEIGLESKISGGAPKGPFKAHVKFEQTIIKWIRDKLKQALGGAKGDASKAVKSAGAETSGWDRIQRREKELAGKVSLPPAQAKAPPPPPPRPVRRWPSPWGGIKSKVAAAKRALAKKAAEDAARAAKDMAKAMAKDMQDIVQAKKRAQHGRTRSGGAWGFSWSSSIQTKIAVRKANAKLQAMKQMRANAQRMSRSATRMARHWHLARRAAAQWGCCKSFRRWVSKKVVKPFVEKVVKPVVKVVKKVVAWTLDKLLSLFDINLIECSAEGLSKKNLKLSCRIKGTAMKKNFDKSFTLTWPPSIENVFNGIKDQVARSLGF
eukprot:TRINITY_DN5087_c0_g1_i1.p1 TRINITY_DN5087_c0_g1~~TRINITY_DN5087_c0_g1_i1.p1  ORF type:complete len:5092 (+),score=1177.13 TRINITY_DN5087_c0_g1_i1:1413-15278(+)